MEAVPKLPMLSFELKISPVCPDFASPFKRFITKYYGEDGDLYDREIMELETLRNSACRTNRDITGCSTLKRYYAQIYSLYNRLVGFEAQVGVQCIWADIYTGQTNIGDLDFELACILYNIGCLHAELGATDSRQTAEEMKVSCTHFQCAAWAFQHLMEDKKHYRSSDMSNDVLPFFVQIMLAQAQECILEKSMLDNRKASIVAKVAAQVVEYYKVAILLLAEGAMNTSSSSSIIEVVGSKLFKEWKKFVEFKLAYYGAIAHLYMGNSAEEQQKMGERVSWFDSADARMKEVMKQAKSLDRSVDVEEAIIFVADVITVKLSNAKKENDFIYHEKVIPPEALAEIKGASLVKGIPFSVTDPEICGQDIFARLVPIEAHETASLYSAQKDEILRNIRQQLDSRNEELAAYLSSIQLDKDTLRTPREDAIPDELIDICAELSLNPGAVDEVERTLTQLDSICEETEKTIEESKGLLRQEEGREKSHQETFGKRPPSLILAELGKELGKHEETHNKAIASNRSLWENFDQHKDDIRVMTSSSASKIASVLPSNKDVPFDAETVKEMERLFDKVEEMKKQRHMLEEKLIKDMDGDNVLKLVLAHSKSEIDTIFAQELKKYDQTVEILKQNLAAQDNILRALTNTNARYAETRRAIIEIQRNRKTRIASLMYTFQVFKELQTNSKKGLEFYHKFQGIVTRLNARIRGVSRVQEEERTQFVNAHSKKLALSAGMVSGAPGGFAAGSFAPSPSPGHPSMAPQSSVPPPIPATGAKLKDFLPYMNQAKSLPGDGCSGAAIPVASYHTSTSIGPLSQNYPPPSMTPQSSQYTPSAPIPSSTPLQQPPPATPSPSVVPPSPPVAFMTPPPRQQPQPQPPFSSYGYHPSPQPQGNSPAQATYSPAQAATYSPPPSYTQAMSTTVPYSLPAITPINSGVSVQASNLSHPSQTHPSYPYGQQMGQQQPIPSVLPIQSQQQQHLPSNSPYASNVASQAQVRVQPYGNQGNYSSSQLGATPQGSSMPPTYGSVMNYSSQSLPMTGQETLSNSYYYPAQSVIGAPNNQPSASQSSVAPPATPVMYQVVRPQVGPQLSSQQQQQPQTYQQPQTQQQQPQTYQQQPQTYLPAANNAHSNPNPSPSMYPQYQAGQTMVHASAYYSPTGNANAATYPSTPPVALPQPQQPVAPVYPSSMVHQPQQPLPPATYMAPTGAQQYTQPQPPTAGMVPNCDAATVVKAIEIESKGGWPVMMPMKMRDQTLPEQSVPTGQTGANGGVPQGASPSDQLPDILATMSMTENVPSQPSTVLSSSNCADKVCKSVPAGPASSPAPAATTTNSEASVVLPQSNGARRESAGEPKDVLSQFDPFFT